MHQQKRSYWLWFLLPLVAIVATTVFTVVALLHPGPVKAAAGINEQINFQGRLLTNTGAVVPDGNYNVQFKIYQDGNGILGGGDETLKWTETRESGNKVLVKNGYFSVYLGSVTAFGGSIDWNQDTLWLSINIGGTASPSYDGEMSPFTRFSSTPYALTAKYLGGLDKTGFIQNQNSSQQATSNFWISGTGRADTSFSTPLLTTASGNLLLDPASDTIIQGSTANTSASALKVTDSGGSNSLLLVRNDGNVGIGTSAPLTRLDVVGSTRLKATATSVLTGSIDPTASTSVTGVSTLFNTELVVGDRITVSGETRTVITIASNTSLTVDTAFSDNANDTSVDRLPAALTVKDSSNGLLGYVRDDGALHFANSVDGNQIGRLIINYQSSSNPVISGEGGSIYNGSDLIFMSGKNLETIAQYTTDFEFIHTRPTSNDHGWKFESYDEAGSSLVTRFRVGGGDPTQVGAYAKGVANQTADLFEVQNSAAANVFAVGFGTKPVTVAGAGTSGGTVLTLNGNAGGDTSGTGTTAGAGSAVSLTAGAGGTSSGGTNVVGGAGGAITLNSGAGGASTGSAVNSNGGTFTLQGGAPGTGGGGAAGIYGNIVMQSSGGNVLVGTNTSTTANAPLEVQRNQNSAIAVSVRNTDGGTGALSAFSAYNDSSGVGYGLFGAGGTGYTTLAILQDRAFVDSGTNLSGIAINTQGAQPIVFGVNNSEVGRFHTDGNFGLGDTSPAYMLTVGSGDLFGVNSSGNVVFSDTAHTISTNAETTANAAGNNLTVTAGAANGSTTGNVGGVLVLQGGAAAGSGNNNGGNITLDGGAATGTGTKGYVVLQGSTGSVGIGAIAPLDKLDLQNGNLRLEDSTVSTTAKFDTAGSSVSATGNNIIINGSATARPEIALYRGNNQYPQFAIKQTATANQGASLWAGTGSAVPIEAVTIRESGNVGIGTTTPGALLDVNLQNASSITAEKIGFRNAGTAQTLTDGTTISDWRAGQFIAPTLNGVAAGGTETVTNAATLYVNDAPSGSNITITNPYALWVDSGLTRLDGALSLSTASPGTAGTYLLSSTNSTTLNTSSQTYGLFGEVTNAGTGNIQGVRGAAQSNVAGTVAQVSGVSGSVRAQNASTVITSGRTLEALAPSVTGAITTQNGLYVANQGAAGVTTAYGLFVATQSGAGTNYAAAFQGGNVGIGTTTPGAALDVNGTAIIQGASALTLGLASTNTGAAIFKNSGGTNTVTLQASNTNPGSSFAITLPTSAGSASDCLKNTGTPGVLTFGSCSATSVTLQSAYDAGNTITTTDARNIDITLADTATDQTFRITQAGTANALFVGDDGTFTDSTPFVIDASGNVGIGTASPVSTLQAKSTTFGSYSSATGVTADASFLFQSDLTTKSTNTYYNGGNFETTTAFSTVGSQYILSGLYGGAVVKSGDSATWAAGSSIAGASLASQYYGTGSIPQIYGLNITNLRGTSAGTVTNLDGINISQSNLTGSGTIAKISGITIQRPASTAGATITNIYGMFINNQTPAAGTLTNPAYGIYQAGTGDYNYFGGNVGIGETTPAALLTVGNGDLFQVNSNGSETIAQSAVSGGQIALKVTPGAHTAVTAEAIDLQVAAHTDTITGGYSTQRFTLFSQPTITAGSALTVTDSATVAIAGAPIKAGSAVLTNTYGLLIQGNPVSTATNSYGLSVNAQSGASNNYAAIFQGGNVGIGTASPSASLNVVRSTAGEIIKVQSTDGGATVEGLVSVQGDNAADKAISVQVTSDTFARFVVTADGQVAFGSGSGSRDVGIYRSAAKTLTLYDNVSGSTNAALVVQGTGLFKTPVDSTTGFQIQDADGGTPILNVDTDNERVGIGTAAPSDKLEVVGDIVSKGTSWTTRTSAADNNWQSVTYGNGMFVAVAGSGTGNRVMTSPDGINWTTRTSAADNDWRAVTYGNGLFVAVAGSGTGNRVMTSPDGINWTIRTSSIDSNWLDITYGNGLFVAVADTGGTNSVMTSPDGITWTTRTAVSNTWASVTYGNGLFVAVAYTAGTQVMTSSDGITWAGASAAASKTWTSVTYGNGLFVAVAQPNISAGSLVMTSTNGTSWTSRTSAADNDWHGVTYGDGLFVAVGKSGTGNRVMTSPDGTNWVTRTSAADNTWERVTYGNGMFVSASSSGTGNRVMTSGKTDLTVVSANNLYQGGLTVRDKLEVIGDIYSKGTSWTTRTSAADNNWVNVAYGNGLFVATGISGSGNRVMTSPDGINWTTRTTPADNSWYGITYGNGLFVATATSGTGNRVMTSPDGINWTIRASAADSGWNNVTYGEGMFVAVANGTSGGNKVMTSPDGITWTLRTTPADNEWYSVTYGNGQFVAVGYAGTANRVMTSPNGITWTLQTSAADIHWTHVTYGNGMFVAVANNDVSSPGQHVMTSPDGVAWTLRNTPADIHWMNVVYAEGLFVAISNSGTGNRVMTSPDGINWTIRPNPTDNNWEGLAYGNGIFVAVAWSGTGNRAMTSGKTNLTVVSADNLYQGGITSNGNIVVGAQGDATAHNFASGCGCLTNSAVGTFGSGAADTNRDAVTSSVVYKGKLFISTKETDLAGVYRYDGGTNPWTLVTNAAGKAVSGDTANIDSYTMTVYNGTLYIGSQGTASTAGLYSSTTADTGTDVFSATLVNPARGSFGMSQTVIDGVADIAIWRGTMYVLTQEANVAELGRWDGGTTFTQINATDGKGAAEVTADIDGGVLGVFQDRLYWGAQTAALTARIYTWNGTGTAVSLTLMNTAGTFGADGTEVDVTSMSVWNGDLYIAVSKADAAGIYRYNPVPYSVDATSTNWQLVSNAVGKVTSGDTANIDSVILRTYNGRLYAGSANATNGTGALYEYDGTKGNWTLINTTRGDFNGNTTTDAVSMLQEFNGTLYVGVDDGTANKGAVYTWSKTAQNSYALRFDSGGNNYGAISFVGNRQASDGIGHYGVFNFSNSIALSTGAFDYAEDYPTLDSTLKPGEPVSVDPSYPEHVKRARPGETILGVVSENPGLRLSSDATPASGAEWVPIALVGRVPVIVSGEAGPIKAGDLLEVSNTPGVLRKAGSHGQVAGSALESYTSAGVSKIMMFVNPTWYVSDEWLNSITNNVDGIKLSSTDGLTIENGEGEQVANIDRSGNATFAGTVTADKIKANQIEGLEIYTDKLGQLIKKTEKSQTGNSGEVSNTTDSTSTPAMDLNNLSVQQLMVALNVHVDGKLFAGGLEIEGEANFLDLANFQKLVTFNSRAIFKQDVQFLGRPTFNNDTGGFATIKQGHQQVEIKFTKEYAKKPVVNATVTDGQFITYTVKDVSEKGFIIILKDPAQQDIQFNWTAFAIDNAQTQVSKLPDGLEP